MRPDIRLQYEASDEYGRLTPPAGLSPTDLAAEWREFDREVEARRSEYAPASKGWPR